MSEPNADFIYKVVTRAVLDAARAAGEFPRAPIDLKDGFIHFSTASQLSETLRLYFAGQSDLAVIAVRTADLGEGLRWEPSRAGALFPHHYGTLGASAIGQTAIVSVSADGSVTLPGWVR
jgi:uncharacterized protein (DUF952 family)